MIGKNVTYGETIQLRHIHSQGFLTVDIKSVAKRHGSVKVYID